MSAGQEKLHKSRLGQLLINKGLISEEQLLKAIAHQQQTGQRLGEVLAEWKLVTEREIDKALSKQKHLRLAAALVTALLGPFQMANAAEGDALLAAQIAVTQSIDATDHALQAQGGPRLLSEAEMGGVVAQGLPQNMMKDMQEQIKKGDGLATMGEVAKLMMPVLGMLDANVSMKDVQYDSHQAAARVNPDGSIELRVPTSIGEISFDNIRVKGSTGGPSMGSLTFTGIDLTGTSVKITPHRS